MRRRARKRKPARSFAAFPLPHACLLYTSELEKAAKDAEATPAPTEEPAETEAPEEDATEEPAETAKSDD